MGDLNILSRPVCWSVIARTNKYAGSRYILKPDELSIPGQLARSKSAESAALCPSDMMLCVISYWVLYYLAQNGGRSSSSATAHSPGKLLK